MFEELSNLYNPINIKQMKDNIGIQNSKFIVDLISLQLEKDFQAYWVRYLQTFDENDQLLNVEELGIAKNNFEQLKNKYKANFLELVLSNSKND